LKRGASTRSDACVRRRSSTARPRLLRYGIPANIDWKHSLGGEWDQYGIVLPLLAQSSLDEDIDRTRRLAGAARGAGANRRQRVAVGVIDVATDVIETPHDVRATLELARRYLPEERSFASTNCGMAPMNRSIAYRKLQALAAGAKLKE